MKAYTDIDQSKKLAEILPIESADMYYFTIIRDYPYSQGKIKTIAKIMDGSFSSDYDTPCWSLAPLRDCLPSGISIDGILYVFESHNTFDNEWVYEYKFEDISAPLYSKSSNEIDAAVEMIIQLKENKMI